MTLYEIALPVFTNNRRANYEKQTRDWETFALKEAEGFTRVGPVNGAWRDPVDGKEYRDPINLYRVACTSEIWDKLVRRAFELFEDQLAIYTASIGEAFIINRPKQSDAA